MITTFLFDILPLWLEKAAETARRSSLFALLSWFWGHLRRLWEQSLCCRLWQGSRRLQEWTDHALPVRWMDSFLQWLTRFIGKCFGWMVAPVQGSLLAASVRRIPRYNFAWIYGLVLLICYCCPGPLWRNQYGLILSFCLFFIMVLESWDREQYPIRIRDLGLWFVAFMFAATLAVVNANDRAESIRVYCFFLTAFLFCISVVGTVTNRGRLMAILGFLYAALVLTGCYAILQRIQGVEVSASLTDLNMNAGMPGRVYSTLDNPNNYAEFIVLVFPVSLIFCANIVDRRWKTLALGSLLIPVVALLMTYSRSSWVSFALAAVVFLALYDKRLLPLIVIAAVLAAPVLPDSIFNRILTIGNTADTSNAYRLYIWQSTLHMIRDFGLTGIGLGPENFIPLYANYCSPLATIAPHSHMLYLEVWLEMGVLGIVSFLGLYLGTLRKAIRAAKKADPLLRHVLIACASSLAGVSFVGAAEYIWFYPRIMFMFFILLGITLAAVKLARETE